MAAMLVEIITEHLREVKIIPVFHWESGVLYFMDMPAINVLILGFVFLALYIFIEFVDRIRVNWKKFFKNQ